MPDDGELVRTEMTITPRQLRAVTSWEGLMPERIDVCAGAWIREGLNYYRLWQYADWEWC